MELTKTPQGCKGLLNKIIFIGIVSTQITILHGQNLVPNSGFEDTIKCPDNLNQIAYAVGWYTPTPGSSDYYNSCSSNGLGVPQNMAGWEYAKDGNAYAGILSYMKTGNNIREYLQIQLMDTLVLGARYNVSFYVSLSDSSGYACNSMGAYLSSTAVSGPTGPLPYTPQVENASANPLLNKNGWTLISDTITATGDELYITIGNFKNDMSSDTVFVGSVSYFKNHTYYYIDAVSVQADHSQGVNENDLNKRISVSPNPSSGVVNIKVSDRGFQVNTVEVLNVMGELVYSIEATDISKIDLRSMLNGIYFLRLKSHVGIIVKKIAIQQ